MAVVLIIFYIVGGIILFVRIKDIFAENNILYFSFGAVYLLPLLNAKSRQSWLDDTGFLLLLLVCNMIVLVFSQASLIRFSGFRKNLVKRNVIWKLLLLITVLWHTILVWSKLAPYNFNILELLISDRVGDYLNQVEETSGLLLRLNYIFHMLGAVYWYDLKQRGRRVSSMLLYSLILLTIVVTTHTRFIVLSYLMIPVFYRHYYIKSIRIGYVVILLSIAGLFLAYTNYVRTGIYEEFDWKNSFSVVIDQLEIESVEDFYMIRNRIKQGSIDFDYGAQYFYYLPITFIPRFLWEGKPVVSYFWRLTEEISGSPPGPNNFVLTSTLFGEGYHQFGIIGLFSSLGMWFLLASAYKSLCSNIPNFQPIWWLFIIHIPMDLRGAISSQIPIFVFNFILLLILTRLLYKSKLCI